MGSKNVKAVVVKGDPRENMISAGHADIRALAKTSRDEFIAPLRDFFKRPSAPPASPPVRRTTATRRCATGAASARTSSRTSISIQRPGRQRDADDARRLSTSSRRLVQACRSRCASPEAASCARRRPRTTPAGTARWPVARNRSNRPSGPRSSGVGRNGPREGRLQVPAGHAPRRVRDDGLVRHDEPLERRTSTCCRRPTTGATSTASTRSAPARSISFAHRVLRERPD